MQKVFARRRHGQTFSFYPDDEYHLCHVLRLGIGARFLVNEDGTWYECVVTETQPLRATIDHSLPMDTRLPVEIALYQAVIRPKHLEWAIQKATELGVSKITPVLFARSNRDQVERHDRLVAIATAAARQCGINTLPTVATIQTFAEMMDDLAAFDLVVVPDENAAGTSAWPKIAASLPGAHRIAVVVGPEGGFAATEREALLARANVVATGLTRTILRSETASLYALANIVRMILEGAYA